MDVIKEKGMLEVLGLKWPYYSCKNEEKVTFEFRRINKEIKILMNLINFITKP